MDGKPLTFSKTIVNDRPNRSEWTCECGGTVYTAPGTKFVRCSNGELRCTTCRREARRFGRRGITCGVGCKEVSND